MKQIFTNFKPKYLLLISAIFLMLCCEPCTLFGGAITLRSDNNLNASLESRSTLNDGSDESREEAALDDSEESPFEDEDSAPELPDLIISAVNPGYKLAGKSDVGELIELRNLSDDPLSLAGFSLRYTNGAGKTNLLFDFPDGSLMTGEYLLLSYKNSPYAPEADVTYTVSLALSAGPLELFYLDELVDTVCWTGSGPCIEKFKTASPTTAVRNLEDGSFIHQVNFLPHFSVDTPQLYLPPPEVLNPNEDEDELDDLTQAMLVGACKGIEFTEVYSYYSSSQEEQFIELYNRSNMAINLENCQIRYKNKLYTLSGNISPDEYFAYYPKANFSLTKNPTTSNSLELVDLAGELIDELIYQNGQKKTASYAKFIDFDNSESWAITYSPTPGATNVFQEFQTCPAGKVINPETGNCIKATSVTTTECPAGKYRNPLTGRCKNIESTSSTSSLKPCAEGYERNPTTNRCRKIKTANEGADYALVPTTSNEKTKTVFTAIWIVIALIAIGVIYIALQFRHEITRAARKASQRINNFRKDLVARKISSHRKKDS